MTHHAGEDRDSVKLPVLLEPLPERALSLRLGGDVLQRSWGRGAKLVALVHVGIVPDLLGVPLRRSVGKAGDGSDRADLHEALQRGALVRHGLEQVLDTDDSWLNHEVRVASVADVERGGNVDHTIDALDHRVVGARLGSAAFIVHVQGRPKGRTEDPPSQNSQRSSPRRSRTRCQASSA